MTFKEKIKTYFKLMLINILAGMVIGSIIGIARSLHIEASITFIYILKGLIVGGLISGSIFGIEFILLPDKIYKLPYYSIIIFKALIYTLLISILFSFATYMFRVEISFSLVTLISIILMTFLLTIVVNFIMIMNRLLGKRTLYHLLIGKYHKPQEEKRIFMFLDMCLSTTIAEKIGHVKFYNFLNDFIFDITGPIISNRGQIYKYVGDEILVVWKLEKDRAKNFSCIQSFIDIEDIIDNNKQYYINKYGFVPTFKAGLHGGAVISAEIGDFKKEISFLGDVVNTTSRLQQECNVYDKNLLISRTLYDTIHFPENFNIESLDIVKLRGKEEEVEILSLTKQV